MLASTSHELLRQLGSYHQHRLGRQPVPAAPPDASPYALPDSILKLIEEQEALQAQGNSGAEEQQQNLGSLYSKAAGDGELLDEGVTQLLDLMRPTETSVFADLGSGKGGALFRVAAAASLSHCYGIELIVPKHVAATSALEALRPSLRTPITLLQGDVIDLPSWASPEKEPRLADLTHAFANTVLFDDFLLRRMAAALGDREAFPKLQSVVSTRELPSQPHLARVGSIPLTCSWNANVKGHVYVPSDLAERPEEAWRESVPMLERFLCDGGSCTLPAALQWRSGTYIRLPR